MNNLNQCPYDKATECKMDEPCEGCETWAQAKGDMMDIEQLLKELISASIKMSGIPFGGIAGEKANEIIDKILSAFRALESERDSWKKEHAQLLDDVHEPLKKIKELESERDKWKELSFAPLGDNHHNAAACPHCNPEYQKFEKLKAERAALQSALKEKSERVAGFRGSSKKDDCGNCLHKFGCRFSPHVPPINKDKKCMHYRCCYVDNKNLPLGRRHFSSMDGNS